MLVLLPVLTGTSRVLKCSEGESGPTLSMGPSGLSLTRMLVSAGGRVRGTRAHAWMCAGLVHGSLDFAQLKLPGPSNLKERFLARAPRLQVPSCLLAGPERNAARRSSFQHKNGERPMALPSIEAPGGVIPGPPTPVGPLSSTSTDLQAEWPAALVVRHVEVAGAVGCQWCARTSHMACHPHPLVVYGREESYQGASTCMYLKYCH